MTLIKKEIIKKKNKKNFCFFIGIIEITSDWNQKYITLKILLIPNTFALNVLFVTANIKIISNIIILTAWVMELDFKKEQDSIMYIVSKILNIINLFFYTNH